MNIPEVSTKKLEPVAYSSGSSRLEYTYGTSPCAETGNLSEPKKASLIFPAAKSASWGYLAMKRLMDIVCSLFGLIILSPLLLIIALAIRLDSKGNAIYSQQRIGKDGKPFTMYKFRSMVENAESQLQSLQEKNEMDGPVFKISSDPRITRVGKLIRKTSIDELPQLINILRGEMSIVGPRPPLPNEVEKYNAYQKQRLSVTPGLTCFWQIHGRNDISFSQWVEMDLRYIRERSLTLDIKLIFMTIPAVIFGKGAC